MAKKKNVCDHYTDGVCPYKKYRVCQYKECYLPNNNKRFWFQLVYLIIAFAVLIRSPKEFTFFSLLLYAAPILLDLISTELSGTTYNVIRYAYIVLNVSIVVFCLLGVFGLLNDTENTFIVTGTSLVFPGLVIQKQWILWPMAFDIVIPAILYVACPNKSMKSVIDFETCRGKAE